MSLRDRLFRQIRQLVAAILLLAGCAVGGEIWLRKSGNVPVSRIADRAIGEVQHLLVASAVRHHELRRNMSGIDGNSGRIQFRTDRFGMRGVEAEIPRPVEIYRVLFLGDETVCGAVEEEDRTLPGLLSRYLESHSGLRVEVLNAGVPGYCPLLSWLWYEHELHALQADLVILHVDMTDVADDQDYRRFLDAGGDLPVCCHSTLSGPFREATQMALIGGHLRRSAAIAWAVDRSLRSSAFNRESGRPVSSISAPLGWIADNPADLRIAARNALRPIADLQQKVEGHGGRLLVVTCPVYWQLMSAEGEPEQALRNRIEGITPFSSELPFEVLKQYCRQAEISFHNATPAFREYDQPHTLYARPGLQLSAAGNAVYAREIGAFLLSTLGNEG